MTRPFHIPRAGILILGLALILVGPSDASHAVPPVGKGVADAPLLWKKVPSVGAALQLQADVAPLFAALFEPNTRNTYSWSFSLDTHGDGTVNKSATVVCKAGKVQRAQFGSTALVHACHTCRGRGVTGDYSPDLDLCFVASSQGLWDGSEAPPATRRAAAALLAQKPVFAAQPKATTWTYKEVDEGASNEDLVTVRAAIVSKPGGVWCSEASWEAMYSPSRSLCLKAGVGMVSYTSSGDEGPSDASYALFCYGADDHNKAMLKGYSPKLRMFTVERVKQSCSLNGGKERRVDVRVIEVYNAKGKVLRRFRASKSGASIGGKPALEPASKYAELLETGGFVAPKASLKSAGDACVASMHVLSTPVAGVNDTPYLVRMKVKNNKKTVLWARLMAGAEPGGATTKWQTKTFFLPEMRTLVVQGSAPPGVGKPMNKTLFRVFPAHRFKKLRKCF